MFFVLIADGAVFSEVFFFSMRVVCFVFFLQGRVVAEQIIGRNVKMAGDTQKFVPTDSTVSFFDAAQGALMDAKNVCQFSLLHIMVGSEVGNSFADLLIAQIFTP